MTEIRVLGIPELSKESGISKYALRKMCKDGTLPFLKVGSRWLIKISDFEKLFTTEEHKND